VIEIANGGTLLDEYDDLFTLFTATPSAPGLIESKEGIEHRRRWNENGEKRHVEMPMSLCYIRAGRVIYGQ